jgi:flagellar assembly protein FliH
MAMSARLFKGGLQVGVAFAPFTIPVKEEPLVVESFQGDEPTVGETPVLPNLEEIEHQAQELLATAQAQADELLTQAQARLAQIEAEAYEKGLTAARAKVAEEVNVAVADLREKLTHTLSELEPLYAQIAARAERDLVKLALEIARKVVHREATSDPDIVLTLARVALERLHPRALAKVLLHPDDFAYVNARRHELSHGSTLELVADASITRGGCLVQSEHGDMDARLEQQFASIERGFFQ